MQSKILTINTLSVIILYNAGGYAPCNPTKGGDCSLTPAQENKEFSSLGVCSTLVWIHDFFVFHCRSWGQQSENNSLIPILSQSGIMKNYYNNWKIYCFSFCYREQHTLNRQSPKPRVSCKHKYPNLTFPTFYLFLRQGRKPLYPPLLALCPNL